MISCYQALLPVFLVSRLLILMSLIRNLSGLQVVIFVGKNLFVYQLFV